MKTRMRYMEKLLEGVEVEWKPLGEVLAYEQPQKYLVSTKRYDNCFSTPVITAGKTFVLGFTGEETGIFDARYNKVIIFDDFTTDVRWIDFKFKLKSSAIKIIYSKNEKNVLSRYAFFFLEKGLEKVSQSDHRRKWISVYSKELIPIPPLHIQTKIVQILDTFTALTAELTAELTARKKQYTYYREKLLQFGPDMEWKSLEELFEFKNGINKDKKYFGHGAPIINYTDVFNKNKIFRNSIKGQVETDNSEQTRFGCKRGDVFFTRTSETQQEIGYSSVLLSNIESCVFSGFLIRARPLTDKILPEYCAYCFSSSSVRKEIVASSNMTTRVTTTGKALKKIKIPVPSLKRQYVITDILDKFDELTNSITEGLPREIELRQKQYEYYRDMLLSFPKPPKA